MGDMDSGNSGSIQSSSSGGTAGDNDQEYESRDSFSAFFNPTAAFENAQSLQLYPFKFSTVGSSSSSPLVFDAHHQQLPNCFGSSFETPNNFIPINNTNNTVSNSAHNNSSNGGFGPIRPVSEDAGLPSVQPRQPNAPHQGTGPGRNPKKRSRASRRAPTTVMTTDASNFRQMVQEFTGIPAPPFSASTFPSRTRLDLFGFGSTGSPRTIASGSGLGLGSGSSTPLRPFPQKMHPNISLSSTGEGDANNFQMSQNFLTLQSLLQPSAITLSNLGSGHGRSTTAGISTTATTTAAPHFGNGGGGLGLRCESPTDNPVTRWDPGLHQGLGLTRHGNQTRHMIDVTGSENNGATLRPESMLDSWICSSDT